MTEQAPRETWGSGLGFLLATVGSAIGIGSIWKFPYEVGSNGGGAFVAVYLAGLALVVVPLLFAEFAIGRRGRNDAVASMLVVAADERVSPRWRLVGYWGALTSFLVLSFYAVIGGWTLYYAVVTLINGLPGSDGAAVQARFDGLLSSPARMVVCQSIFLLLLALTVARGVQRGIEQAMKVLMPVLAVLLVAMAVYSCTTGDAREAARFLFVPDFGDLTARGVLEALGLGFFSIGVGLGLMITYAGYSTPDLNLRQTALLSVGADTAVSLLAGLAVFPIVFANDLDPASGPGLVFVSLPLAFAEMPAARVAASAFFALLFIAALASAVSMLEGVIAVVGHQRGWPRRKSLAVVTPICVVVGLGTVWSFNRWRDWHPLRAIDRFADHTFFDLLDEATSNLMLPVGGLAVALFTGWVVDRRFVADALELQPFGRRVLRAALRYLAPVAIVGATVGSWL